MTHLQAPLFLTEMIVSAFQGVVMSWAYDEHYELDEHLEQAAHFLWRAIASKDGASS